MRILAVDWGERRVGLAVSDPSGVIATALATLKVRGREDAVDGVARAAAEQSAEAFAAAIASRTGLPVDTYDERLTSALSQRRMHETGMKPGRAKERVDQGAAVALLESYLQRRSAR